MPYNFGDLPTNISRASDRRDFIWDTPCCEGCRRVVRHKDQKNSCADANAGSDAQASETFSEENDTQPIVHNFATTQEDFTHSFSQSDTEVQIKAETSVSDADSHSRREPGPKSN
jgi:hypothetical protein